MAEIPLGPGGPTEEIEQAAEQLDILEFPKQYFGKVLRML